MDKVCTGRRLKNQIGVKMVHDLSKCIKIPFEHGTFCRMLNNIQKKFTHRSNYDML